MNTSGEGPQKASQKPCVQWSWVDDLETYKTSNLPQTFPRNFEQTAARKALLCVNGTHRIYGPWCGRLDTAASYVRVIFLRGGNRSELNYG